tara:strand:+ start:61 stop:375 length:315 start_codon:yes stop_codon:yes gene_type:complete
MSKGFRDGTHYMVDSRAIEAVITIMSKFRNSINMSQKNKATITRVMEHLLDSPTIKYSGFNNRINAVDEKPVSPEIDDMLINFDAMLDELGLKLPNKNEDDEEL